MKKIQVVVWSHTCNFFWNEKIIHFKKIYKCWIKCKLSKSQTKWTGLLYFLDARNRSKIDLFSAWSDIYIVKFDLFVFIEGVIFQNGHSNIKPVVWYGDSRIERFLMISSHLHKNFQLWSFFLLSNQNFNSTFEPRSRRIRGWDLYQMKALNV